MNQRDQYSGSSRRGGRQQNEQQGGRSGRSTSQRSIEEERDWQSQREAPRGRSFARSMYESYNPEPQWLREDEYRGASAYERDDEEMSTRGWGREMGSGQRGLGGQRGDIGRSGYAENREFARGEGIGGEGRYRGASGFEDEGYGIRESGYAMGQREPGYSQRELGQGRGYGLSSGAYGTQGRFGSQGFGSQSEYGRGAFQGGNQEYGSNVGRAQFDPGATGRYQSGLEGQRSYRGMGPQNYNRSDDRIRDDICERLTDDDRIDASKVTIDVNQRTVTLSGTVPERSMRYFAEDLVDDVLGVQSINNQLKVQQSGETGTTIGSTTETKRH